MVIEPVRFRLTVVRVHGVRLVIINHYYQAFCMHHLKTNLKMKNQEWPPGGDNKGKFQLNENQLRERVPTHNKYRGVTQY